MSAPSEAGRTRQSPRIRGFAPFAALAWLFVLLSALPGYAQSLVTSLTGMNGPTFVAIDADRTIGGTTATWLYVAEHGEINNTGGGRILRFNLTSGATTPVVVATSGTGNGQFISPDAIIIDGPTGDLIIADRGLDRVQRITNTGTFVSSFGTPTTGAADEMHGPVGMARDASGNLYIAEHGDTTGSVGAGGSFVSKYNASGVRQWRVGGIGSGNRQFANTGPYGVALSGSNLLVSDSFNARIQVLNADTGAYQSQFSLPGTLPLGLSIDSTGALWVAQSSGGGTGAIQRVQRMPVTGGAATMTISGGLSLPFHTVVDTVANRAYVADYGNDRVAVYDISSAPPPAVPVVSNATVTGTVGTAISPVTVAATNSPTSFSADGLAAYGLSISNAGVISGTPSALANTSVTVTATNSAGTSAPANITLNITSGTTPPPPPPASPAPVITSFALDRTNVTATTAGFIVTFDKAVTGVDAADFSVATQGSATATITGVTAVSGTQHRVNISYGGTDGSIQLAIRTSGHGIAAGSDAFEGRGITATAAETVNSNPPADGNRPVVQGFTAAAPSGLTVNYTLTFNEAVTGVDAADFLVETSSGVTGSLGAITGSGTTYTIPVTLSGTGSVRLVVVGGTTANIRDAALNWFGGNGDQVSAVANLSGGGGTPVAPVISSATSATATVGTAFSYTIAASNSPTSYAATNLSGTGLSLNTSTGVISGTPTAAGTITSQLTATNSAGTSAPVTLTITVNSSGGGGTAPVISSATSASATAGSAFSYQITASGSPTSYAATGLAGTGLSLDANSGLISGTPTAAGTITSSLTATNATGTSAPVTLTITVNPAGGGGSAPVISSATTANATVGSAFSYQINASESPTSYAATGLADTGLSLNTSTGLISGTPTAAGTITSSLTATNATGTSAPVSLTITVSPAGGGGGSAPSVTSAAMTVRERVPMVYQVIASNSPTAYTLTGAPAGLMISETGVISGTPVGTGTYDVIVTAINDFGSGTGTVSITLEPQTDDGSAPQMQVITFIAPVSNVFVGDTITLGATSNSGLTDFTYSVVSGSAIVSGNELTVTGEGPIVVRAAQAGNSMWGAASSNAAFTAIRRAQVLTFSDSMQPKAYTDRGVTLDATTSSGLPITYTVVSGPATVDGNMLTFTGSGTVVVRATQSGNGTYAPASRDFEIEANPIPRLVNIASRARVSANDADGATIAGFVVVGSAPKQFLIRAVGPTLSALNVPSPLADPTLKLYNSAGTVIATNSGWNNDAAISAAANAVGAFALNAGSLDAAILTTLEPGAYTVMVQSAANSGTALIEVYDASANAAAPTKQLINISTRAVVGIDSDVLIGGFVVSGNEPKKLLIRGVGPGLGVLGVTGLLNDPVVTVYNAQNQVIAQNNNWGTPHKVGDIEPATGAQIAAAANASGAFGLTEGSADASLLVSLPPGNYTVIVSGVNNTTGNALMEIYEVPNP